MDWLKTIGRASLGLFVDDGSLAAAILIWLVLAWLGHASFHLTGSWQGVLLFAGLALILVENACRRARTPR